MKKRHKNVNLGVKRSRHNAKQTEKWKLKWKKVTTVEKRHKNVNLGDKKLQTSEKKTQKSLKFGSKKMS